MIEVAIICTSITTSFTLMTLKRLLPSIQLVPVIEIPLGVQHAETVGIRMLEMLMRPLLAGRHPGNLHAGRSQIEIKLDPEPPTKTPAGSNDEHLTRKPPDSRQRGRIPLSSLAPTLHGLVRLRQGARAEGTTRSRSGTGDVIDTF